jgi:membrane protein DedA with SNARE-associated domain
VNLELLQESILAWMLVYGPLVLATAVLIGALGLPLPGTLFLIAAGAFVRQDILNIWTTPLTALVGVVAGDVIGYALGWRAGGWLHGRYGNKPTWVQATQTFNQHGGFAIFITRWLITPIAAPVNWITGSSRYPLNKFLFFDVLGESTWILIYGGLGYFFSSQWETLSSLLSDFSGVIAGIALVAAGLWLARARTRTGLKQKHPPVY